VLVSPSRVPAGAILPLLPAFQKGVSVVQLSIFSCEGHCIDKLATHVDVKCNGFGSWPPIECFFVVPV